jgi:uncharacterized membrane protein
MESKNPFGIQDDGKTAGMLSYFFILGWSMAFFTFHKNEKTSLSSFQLRQTLLLYISYLVIRFGVMLILSHVWPLHGMLSLRNFMMLINIAYVVLWVIGLTGAINGEEKPIPFFGKQAQLVFSTL